MRRVEVSMRGEAGRDRNTDGWNLTADKFERGRVVIETKFSYLCLES